MTHPLGGYSLTNLLPTTLVRETPVSRKHGLVLNIGLSKGLYRDAKNKSQPGANGQYKVTVPKGIAEAMALDGQRLEWKVKSGNTLEVTVVNE